MLNLIINPSVSQGGGNATVPNDAPIQPPQAFVDGTGRLLNFSSPNSNAFGAVLPFGSIGATRFTNAALIYGGVINTNLNPPSFLSLYGSTAGANPCVIDLSGNALPQADVDAAIAAVELGREVGSMQTLSINVSGLSMAAPTLPVFTIDFNPLNSSGDNTYGTAWGGSNLIIFNMSENLADSSIDFTINGNGWTIGIADSPTKQQIIDKLVALGGGKITDLGGLKISVAPTDHALEPLDFTGMTGSSLTQGNYNIGNLRQNGNTVITDWTTQPPTDGTVQQIFTPTGIILTYDGGTQFSSTPIGSSARDIGLQNDIDGTSWHWFDGTGIAPNGGTGHWGPNHTFIIDTGVPDRSSDFTGTFAW